MFHFLKHINRQPDYVIADNPNDKDFILALHKENWEITQLKKNQYELVHNNVKVLVKLNDNDWQNDLNLNRGYHKNFQVRSKKDAKSTVFMYPQNTSSFLLDKPKNFDLSKNKYFPNVIWRRAYNVSETLNSDEILKSWKYMRSPYLHKYAAWMANLGSIVADEYKLSPNMSIKADPNGEFLFIKRQGSPKTDAYKMLEKAWKMAPWRKLAPNTQQGTTLCSSMILITTLPAMSMHQKFDYYDKVLNDQIFSEMEKFYNKSK